MIVDDSYAAQCANPSDINESLPILHKYALECEHIIEFGVRSVVSTWAFLAARPKKLVSYDLHDPNNFGGNLTTAINAANEAGVVFEFHQKNVLEITIEPTDMLFIDTLHTYNQLKKELELHAHNVRKYLAFHDTYLFRDRGEQNCHKGLWPAITEFLNAHPEWFVQEKVDYNNGLTVLKHV